MHPLTAWSELTLARVGDAGADAIAARRRGTGALDAIRAALEGKPWLPPTPATS